MFAQETHLELYLKERDMFATRRNIATSLPGGAADPTRYVNQDLPQFLGRKVLIFRVSGNHQPGTFELGILIPATFLGLKVGLELSDHTSKVHSFERLSYPSTTVSDLYKVVTVSGSVYQLVVLY